jgi:hypothetical protein
MPAHDRNHSAYSFYSLVNFYKGNLFTKMPWNLDIELKMEYPVPPSWYCEKVCWALLLTELHVL